jgi:NAD(P)-dependent dehydrogenase (short-subunit alcohol dehydrogenase family)
MNSSPPSSYDFSGRHAIVTGGAKGIGRCIAEWLLKSGAAVTIADPDSAAGSSLAAHYPEGTPLLFIPTDVADEAQVSACVQKAEAEFGPVSALINNAGIGINKPLEELSLEDWNRVIGTNLTGAFLMSRQCLPGLRETNGTIINIASTRALQSEANTEAYSASKGGILALTHAMAVSLGPKVRVHAISPGWIDVRDWQQLDAAPAPAFSEADHKQHPAGRGGRPGVIAGVVLFLLSDQAGFITGQNFVVDGGMTRKMMYLE